MLRILLILVLFPCFAYAVGLEDKLADPAQEARAQAVFKQLRCMVCTGESIHDSNAELAKDMRHLVRERVANGEDNQQIIDYIATRYGDAVRMEPPAKSSTYLLWFGPLLFLVLGSAALIAKLSRK